MCLYAGKGSSLRKAEEDTECFKVLERHEGLDLWFTPYRRYPILSELIKGNAPFTAREIAGNPERVPGNDNLEIGGGYVHTFVSESDAVSKAEYLVSRDDYPISRRTPTKTLSFAVFRCTIPKGTAYWKGKDVNGKESYASRKITFGEEIRRIERKLKED